MRKNEAKTDLDLFLYIQDNKNYVKPWEVKKTNNKFVQKILDKSSKSQTGNCGYPDLIYVNESNKILILVEDKNLITDHVSKNQDNPVVFAVDGIKHYLKFFTKREIENSENSIRHYFRDWKFIGIAFSGDITDQYNHRINTFVVNEDEIVDINRSEILDELEYQAYFQNIDLEKITLEISRSSSEINRLLRGIDSQKRPILLSALMICLYPKDNISDFRNNYSSWSIKNIVRNIPSTVEDILTSEKISKQKIDVLLNEITFIKTDNDLNSSEVLKDILNELEDRVIPLFSLKTSYDIIGKFYEEFLRFAGITNVKKGIILTPHHITDLFTDLIDIKTNDVIFDPACGTGAFLISGMNKLVGQIENSSISDKTKRIKEIKQRQLIGIEKSTTMYSLAISNMLFRGDGKSQIYNDDFFSDYSNQILDNLEAKPTIGFINPPYGGKDNKSNPTKKEIQFLERMLDRVSRYGIIIAPLSTFFKEQLVRDRILTKHTLKYVINMPGELFQPNAATHTAIAVFETNVPHGNKKIVMCDLKDDGYILSKGKGRTDALNKWTSIKKELITKLQNPEKYQDDVTLVYKDVQPGDEWIIQAHSKTDYRDLKEDDFVKTIKKYVIYSLKLKLDLFNQNIDELSLFEIIQENKIEPKSILNQKIDLNTSIWREFPINKVFEEIIRGKRLIELDRQSGDIPYFSASDYNNGLTDKISNPLYIEKDSLIYSTFGTCYYVEGEFTSSDEISVLKHKKLNLYNGLFLATVINKNKYKYGFGRKAFENKFSSDIIKLPLNEKGAIDFDYMEQYIKTLPYSSNLAK